MLFSIAATPIYIPTKSVGGFPFLHTLSNISCLWTLMIMSYTFSYHFPHCAFQGGLQIKGID